MDIKTWPSQIYIKKLVNDQGNENSIRSDEVDRNQYWGKKMCNCKTSAYI